jgi:hypothetical protein
LFFFSKILFFMKHDVTKFVIIRKNHFYFIK